MKKIIGLILLLMIPLSASGIELTETEFETLKTALIEAKEALEMQETQLKEADDKIEQLQNELQQLSTSFKELKKEAKTKEEILLGTIRAKESEIHGLQWGLGISLVGNAGLGIGLGISLLF